MSTFVDSSTDSHDEYYCSLKALAEDFTVTLSTMKLFGTTAQWHIYGLKQTLWDKLKSDVPAINSSSLYIHFHSEPIETPEGLSAAIRASSLVLMPEKTPTYNPIAMIALFMGIPCVVQMESSVGQMLHRLGPTCLDNVVIQECDYKDRFQYIVLNKLANDIGVQDSYRKARRIQTDLKEQQKTMGEIQKFLNTFCFYGNLICFGYLSTD